MRSEDFLNSFSTHPLFSRFSEIKNLDEKFHLLGCSGSLLPVLISTLFDRSDEKILVVCNDAEEAAYFYNDIQNLIGDVKALYYPASSITPYAVERTQNANVIQRAEVLNQLNSGKHKVIVSYPEALLEKVVSKQNLTDNSLTVNVGDKLSIDFLIDLFFEYEFEREQFVLSPGQFAVRGGLIDVWSFASDRPYRIEFFGDDVESIRTFDPADQLSVNQFKHITIVPNVQEKLLKESRVSFLEFLGKDCNLFIQDVQFTVDRIEKYFNKALVEWDKIKDNTIQLSPQELFLQSSELLKVLESVKTVEYGKKPFFKADQVIKFDSAPQPNFNKNFEQLINNLKEFKQKGYNIAIISENKKQIERIENIFADFTVNGVVIAEGLEFTPGYFTLHEGFIDHTLKLVCYTDHQIFDRYHRFRLKDSFRQSKQAITLKELTGLNKGDYVTHIDYGVGVFDGLEAMEVNGKKQEAIRLLYKDKDILYVSIQSLHRISKFSGKEGKEPKLNKLGTNTWQNKKASAKKKVKEIAYDLIQLYAKRKATKGFEFSPDNYMQTELEASFLFEDTPDQESATIAVKEDMQKPFPMDRLICGDVGFGKTEIAIRAAFKAAVDGKQVAILVPTTILAFQHYKTFRERLKEFPVEVEYINRFRSTKTTKDVLKRLEEGKVDIIIGTHRLVGKDIKYNDLGLLIIDEEQKFGVAVKDKLKTLKANLDTLTLTATPIPRTLQFSLLGARDLSTINTPPPNRYPVETTVTGFNEELIRDAITYELSRGGQVYFIHNRVQNIKEVAGVLQRLVPNAKIGIGHGQMEGAKLEEVMLSFMDGDFDILVATTIIESGLDIPNANTIIINQAQNFGLSDLHQMRGRVGRSNRKAFCFLLAPPQSTLTPEARKRLRALEEFSDLGSGFNISMRDLDIRGAGDLLGAEQSGFMADIGYETYQKILDEAIEELKAGEFKDLYKEELKEENRVFVRDCQIETDMEILFPVNYVNAIDERLSLYKKLNDIETEEELQEFASNLKDRFGELPKPAEELLDTMRLKWLALKIGFERLYIKNGIMRGYFINDPKSDYFQSEKFGSLIQFVQKNPSTTKMKEIKGKLALTFQKIQSISDAKKCLNSILEFSIQTAEG